MWKERILQRILIFFSKWGKDSESEDKLQKKTLLWKILFQEIKALAKKMEIENTPLLEDNLITHVQMNSSSKIHKPQITALQKHL